MECSLSQGELIRLDGGKDGMLLRCSAGTVWLTCGDGTDYLIAGGRSYSLSAGRTAIIEALEPAEFSLGKPASVGLMVLRPLMEFTG